MKKFLKMFLGVAMLVSKAACSSKKEKLYNAGTYSATIVGFGGDVTVSIKVSERKITEVNIEGNDETPTIGGATLDTLAKSILDAQSADVDSVSGATITSNAVKSAASKAISEAKGETVSASSVTDGTYTASATSYSWTDMVKAEVTFTDGKISDITIVEEHDSDTGEIAKTAFDLLPERIIENQSLVTDVITGATVTSNAIKTIVANAIEQAGGNASDWQTPIAKSSETVKLEGYDVIVVGLGGSGILSYCTAADDGASVFGIEASAKLGGGSATTTGPMLLGAVNDTYSDVEFADMDDVYNTWIDYVGSDEKADIIHEAVYNNPTHIKYYVDNFGFEFAGMIMSFVKPEWSAFWTRYVGDNGTSNIFGPNKTNQFDRAMAKAVSLNDKNDYKLEVRAEELLFEDGQVVGVKATGYDGTTYEIYGDSVILATGGFVGNDEMCEEYWGYNFKYDCINSCRWYRY